MKLGEMTWPNVKVLDKSNLVAIYPIAAFEQMVTPIPSTAVACLSSCAWMR